MKKAAPAKKPAAAKAPATKAPAAKKPAPAKPAAKPKEGPKEEEKKVEEVPPPVPEPPKEPVHGKSVIKYSHYKNAFPHVDGKLEWADIDEEYAFDCVFDFYELILKKESDET